MDQKSAFDDVPDELVHRPELLSATRAALDQLTLSVREISKTVLSEVAVRVTAHSSAQALEHEARTALQNLLEDPDELEESLSEVDGEERRKFRSSLEEAIANDLRPAIQRTEDQWMEMTSADLARTIATFWWNLGHDDRARYLTAGRLLDGRDKFGLDNLYQLTERFGLKRADQLRLLAAVQQRASQTTLLAAVQDHIGQERSAAA